MSARILVFTCACVLTLATSAFADEEKLEVAILDVADVVAPRATVRGPTLGAPETHGWPQEREKIESEPFVTIEQLVELLRDTVEPESWEEVEGAEIRTSGPKLWVQSRPGVVRKVKAMLEKVRAEAGRRVLVSVRVREGDATSYPALGDGGLLLESGSLEAPLGVERALAVTNEVRYVGDYAVEIAQGSTISDPIVRIGLEGLVAEIAAVPTLDGDRVLVEATLQRGAFGTTRRHQLALDEEYLPEPFRSPRRGHLGTIELPLYEGLATHVSTLTAPGQLIQIPFVHGGRQWTIELEPRLLGTAPPRAFIHLGALSRRPMRSFVGLPREIDSDSENFVAPRLRYANLNHPAPWVTPEEVVEAIQTLVRPGYWEEGLGRLTVLPIHVIHLSARPDVRDEVMAFLGHREVASLRPLLVDLRILSVPGGDAAIETGPGKSAPASDARLVHAARLPTISGRVGSVIVGSTADFIGDYGVEVAQEARIAVPVIGQSFAGLMANVRPRLSARGDTVALDIEMMVATRTIESKPFETGAQFLGPIDKVEVARTGANTTVHVPVRGSYVIDLGPDRSHEGRRLVAEIRVMPQ